MNLERQKEHFKNHVATLKDYENIKVLDFKNPNSIEYRIRFIFEEDYCRLHISGDLGELTATNYNNMTFEHFSDFVNNISYFKEKIDCHNRAIYYYDEKAAREELAARIKENDLLEHCELYKWDNEDERIEFILDDVFIDFTDKNGIGIKGCDILSELDRYAWEWAGELGKMETEILDLYMLAFNLAVEQLEKESDKNK